MVTVKKYKKKVDVEEIVPSVIEPSFGIGRIMYSILGHNFKVLFLFIKGPEGPLSERKGPRAP